MFDAAGSITLTKTETEIPSVGTRTAWRAEADGVDVAPLGQTPERALENLIASSRSDKFESLETAFEAAEETGEQPSVYDTKTVRLHLAEQGQYCYLMLTRFNGEDHLLADDGWRSTYVNYCVISRNAKTQDAITGDAFALVRDNEWLQDTIAEDFVKDLDMGRIEWEDLKDEHLLDEAAVNELAETGSEVSA